MKKLLVLAATLALASCDRPAHMADVCVQSHTEIQLIPVTQMIGNMTTVTLQTMPYDQCDRTEYQCVEGTGKYAGQTCQSN